MVTKGPLRGIIPPEEPEGGPWAFLKKGDIDPRRSPLTVPEPDG
jgi:hypothetical protein